MIRINLLPVRQAQRAVGRRQQVALLLLSFLVTVLIMTVPLSLQRRKLNQLETDIQRLRGEVAQLTERAREIRDLDKKRADLEAKLKVIDGLNRKRVGPVRVLEDLSSATPEKLWLVEFADVGGAATLTGMALDNQTIAAFMRELLTSSYFYEVDLVETSQAESARGPQVGAPPAALKRFIIKARLDYLGRGGKVPESPQPPAATTDGAAAAPSDAEAGETAADD